MRAASLFRLKLVRRWCAFRIALIDIGIHAINVALWVIARLITLLEPPVYCYSCNQWHRGRCDSLGP